MLFFLYGVYMIMDLLYGGYVVDEDMLKIIGGLGIVMQFKMDYMVGELFNCECNVGQYYNIIEGIGFVSYWFNIWGKFGGVDDVRNVVLNWQNIFYNGYYSLVFDFNFVFVVVVEECVVEV